MELEEISILFTGDLVLDEPDAAYWLDGLAPALRDADLSLGHLEVPHTGCRHEAIGDVPAPGAPPENLAAIAHAGIGMVSLAGNHIADCGAEGIADTIAGLKSSGILYAGAGAHLAEARKPAIAEVKGCRIGMLSYNCVGPELSWAGESSAGCAFLPMETADGSAVTPQADLTSVSPAAIEILEKDIRSASQDADVVIVALHKGIVHTPVTLAPYERPIAHAAVDAGAHIVISHHAHITRGVEFYRGRPIYHGLGNGCVVTRALSPEQDHPDRAAWARKRREMFGFEPDPAYHLAPFHPEAVNAFLGRIRIARDGSVEAGIVPVFIEPPGRPVLARESKSREICDYLEAITSGAGLPEISVLDDGRIVPRELVG
ncbi:CapA family protein [Aurantiacibacter flavus]|uniref:CapA family protein n=1 Tax=Aurantiacibacter flavus TaxID=3145232 RepID=A0ABV0CV34_9SPHN